MDRPKPVKTSRTNGMSPNGALANICQIHGAEHDFLRSRTTLHNWGLVQNRRYNMILQCKKGLYYNDGSQRCWNTLDDGQKRHYCMMSVHNEANVRVYRPNLTQHSADVVQSVTKLRQKVRNDDKHCLAESAMDESYKDTCPNFSLNHKNWLAWEDVCGILRQNGLSYKKWADYHWRNDNKTGKKHQKRWWHLLRFWNYFIVSPEFEKTLQYCECRLKRLYLATGWPQYRPSWTWMTRIETWDVMVWKTLEFALETTVQDWNNSQKKLLQAV